MLSIFFVILIFLASLFASLGFIHIFQLNSYRHVRFLRWAKENKAKFLPYVLVLVLTLIFSLVNNVIGFPFVVIVSVIIAFLSMKKKAKKPLVYTKRVQRLLVTISILELFLALSSLIFKADPLLSAIGFGFTPLIVLLADVINKPIEKSINNYYINDAKKILKSAKGKLKVIGITGSYGKTSVKFYLTSLLSSEFNVLCTPESFNTPLGVVRTVRSSLSAMHDIFVCEMGAKNVGDIKEICDIVSPDHGVITSVGPQHLETFKTLDNVKKTKFELAEEIEGNLFLNGDDENITAYNKNPNAIYYGFSEKCDYRAEIISVSMHGTEFKITKKDGASCEYSTKLIGTLNVLNIVGAVAVSNTLGIPLESLKPQVRKLSVVPHRLELINRGNVSIIDDAYNSNPSGAKAALETLSLFDGMKILVTPGMVELGEKQDECNYNFGVQASSICDFVAVVGKKPPQQSILRGLKDSGLSEDKIFSADNLNEAITKVYSLSSDKRKIILLENDLPDNYL